MTRNSHRSAYALTRVRLSAARFLVADAIDTLADLRDQHLSLVGDLPERLAVLLGLICQTEEAMWYEKIGKPDVADRVR